MPEIRIIYASTSGNVEFVCRNIAKRLTRANIKVSLHRAEMTPISLIMNNKSFIFAASTWDHGIINPFFDKLLSKMEKINLSGKAAGFIGLGDIRYTKSFFCKGVYILKEVFEEKGGKALWIPLKINGDPYDQIDSQFIKIWFKKYLLALRKHD